MFCTMLRFATGALGFLLLGTLCVVAEPSLTTARASERYIATARNADAYEALRADLVGSGATILTDLPEINMMVVRMSPTMRPSAEASPHVGELAKDHVAHLIRPASGREFTNSDQAGGRVSVDLASPNANAVTRDPAFTYPGLMWNLQRINTTKAWRTTTGEPAVTVGVADTGVDFTHSELSGKVTEADVVDFTTMDDPTVCKSLKGRSDDDLARIHDGPAKTDWNGHGTWIAGNIAAALDGAGITGIAPNIGLVPLKISEWCGSCYDSTIITSILYAANAGIDIVSISFGGYLDRSDPEQESIYQMYVQAVKYARTKGTLIVSSAGNEHVRIGGGGRVLSRGSLTTPGDPLEDLFGQYNVPAGIPGVVMVSATGNVVKKTSEYCLTKSAWTESATCKPTSDRHQPFGMGTTNQLAYYSNYGPRVDVAAPGGARKFNLPVYDRGGTPGWPVTEDDGTNVFEEFGITSNWSQDMTCYTFNGGGFPAGQCHTSIQGTSMATPHVSAALALIASANPTLRRKPVQLISILKAGAKAVGPNLTPPLSKTDKTRGDFSRVLCATGYCHLAGDPIPDDEAYGAGLIDVSVLHAVTTTSSDAR